MWKTFWDFLVKYILIMSKIILITGPSGVGKGTIEKELFKDEELNLSFSVSATTRTKRDGEINGQHYFFISVAEFEKLISDNAFLEYNKHFDNYYGTLISDVEKKLMDNKNVLVEVETNGALNIIKNLKNQNREESLLSIFIEPPTLEELERRIRNRNTDNDEQIKKRISKAKEEIECKKYFQHVIVNNHVEESVKKIKTIIKGE